MPTTYVFPGQGSQIKGMGKNLFREASELVAIAESVLGYSIVEICLDNPDNRLNQTQYTQPALFTVNAIMYRRAIELSGELPDFLAGHSLGEYNALLAAEVFDFRTGLQLVAQRGRLMSQVSGGTMAAVLGLTKEKIEKTLQENGLQDIDIANYNTPSQFVLSGPQKSFDRARKVFKEAGAIHFVPLNVSGAFHSRYMARLEKEFADILSGVALKKPKIPVIANCTARPYDESCLAENLTQQISKPVLWIDSILYLRSKGPMQFKEIGPGTVLEKLIKKIDEETAEPPSNHLPPAPPKTQKKQAHEEQACQTALSLGCDQFKQDYQTAYAYVAGAMGNGVSSPALVKQMAKSGLLSHLGTSGQPMDTIEKNIQTLISELSASQPFGVNLSFDPRDLAREKNLVDIFLKSGIKNIEISEYSSLTKPLAQFRIRGLGTDEKGNPFSAHKILAKVARPEQARMFLSPPPHRIINQLLEEKIISSKQAQLAEQMPVADDICVICGTAWHGGTGQANAYLPTIQRIRDEAMAEYRYLKKVRVGLAGGIGCPEATMAAFILGADFVLTGSINQCTVEASTSDVVKDLLQQIGVQDTCYAPSFSMFELGSKVQIVKRGVFFPIRAKNLFDLYQRHNSWDAIDPENKKMIQHAYFRKSFDEIYQALQAEYPEQEIEKAEKNPKYKMALVFRWYLSHGTHWALQGEEDRKIDYQIFCSPALGSFNQWIKGTPLENWRKRNVDTIARKLLNETAILFNKKISMNLKPGCS